jgi:alanyl-tRNA synthetase
MRHHTSTHIVLGAARKIVGQHIWQAGAEKQVDHSRLDITHWKRLTPQQTRQIEKLANDAVVANIPVETSWMQREDAELKYGHRLYQGGVVPGKQIRVVKIEGWDAEACAGTHLRTTGEIGFIKLLHTERIQDGVERIVFASGSAAIIRVQQIESDLELIAETLKVPIDKTLPAVVEMNANLKKANREVEDLKEKQIRTDIENTLAKAKEIDGISLATHVMYAVAPNMLIKISSSLIKTRPCAILGLVTIGQSVNIIVLAGKNAVARGIHSGRIASQIASLLGGGGGGQPNFGQGGGTTTDKIEDAIRTIERIARRQLRGETVES